MTQYEFDPLPLLLRPAEAQMVLAGIARRSFYEMREDGDLRVFQPDPAHAFAYYWKVDVGRAAGLRMDAHARRIEVLPATLSEFQFKHMSGLSDMAILQGIASQQLTNVGKNGVRMFPRSDLSRWLLTKPAEVVKS